MEDQAFRIPALARSLCAGALVAMTTVASTAVKRPAIPRPMSLAARLIIAIFPSARSMAMLSEACGYHFRSVSSSVDFGPA